MASKIAQLTGNPLVREYAYGASQSALMPVASFLAPTVEVGSMKGFYKSYTLKSRFKVPQTRRAIGGRATELTLGATDASYSIQPHAIDMPIDGLEQIEAESGGIDLINESADMAAEVGALAHEKSVISTALTQLGAGTDTNVAAGDGVALLDAQILAMIKAARYGSAMGIRILFGPQAWLNFKNSAAVKSRFVQGNGPQNPVLTEENASQMLLGKPQVMIAYAGEDTAAEGVTDAFDFMLTTACIIFAAKDQPTRQDPSFMKTFRLRNQWMVPGSYIRDDGRVEVLKFDWAEDVKVTNSAAGVRLNLVTA